MRNFSYWLRGFLGGLIALVGASLVGWQAVLIYYLLIGRVKAGEEHPPLTAVGAILLVGVFLLIAGHMVSTSRVPHSR